MSQATADFTQPETADGEANALASDNIQEITTPEVGNDQGDSGEVELTQVDAAPTLNDRISSVENPADFESMMEEVQMNPNMFNAEPEPEPEPVAIEEAEAPLEEQEVTEEEAEAPVSEEGDDPPVEEVTEQGGEKPPQFRLRPSDKLDVEALRIMKAAEAAHAPITLTESLDISKRQLGIVDTAPTQTQTPDNQGDTEEVEDATSGVTLAEAKQELKDLRKQHTQALRDGDLDEAADAMDQIAETEDLIDLVSDREVASEQTARTQHDTNFETSLATATETFPDFGNKESEFYTRCGEIDQALNDTEDPRYYDADKPLMIARMAARELNIAPGVRPAPVKQAQALKAAPVATPQQATTSPKSPRTERRGQLPAGSGASRTQSASTGSADTLADKVSGIGSPEDFERLAALTFANRS
jgi:hypothetical protein